MTRGNFTSEFPKHLLRNVSEITRKKYTHKKYRNSTELSKYIWKLKDANIAPTVTWKVVAKVFSNTKIKFCKLCLTEKVFIINALNDSQKIFACLLLSLFRKEILKDKIISIRNLMFRLFQTAIVIYIFLFLFDVNIKMYT